MKNKGILLAITASVISGISIFSNTVFVSSADPLIFSIVRNGVVALMFTSILISFNQFRRLRTLTKREWGMLAIIGIIGGGIPFALFFSGLAMIGAVSGNILQKTLFLWVALLAVPILKERISRLQLVGYITLFVGMFVTGGTYKLIPSTGSYLILAATILWAAENIIAKVTLKRVPSLIVAWGRMIFGLPCLIIASVIVGKYPLLFVPASYTLVPIVVSSVLLVAYMSTWYAALKRAPATLVSSLLVFAPVITAICSSTILHRAMTEQQMTNIALLTIGTFVIAAGVRQEKRQSVDL